MIPTERERQILDYLRQHRVASTEAIATLTNSSLATTRRDLKTMGLKGLIEKKHGGARALGSSPVRLGYPGLSDDDIHLPEKDQIAAVAAGLVKSGDTIFLGAGKTCALLARYIKDIDNLKNRDHQHQ
jgi:Transcriptional regulators of sugar metabolism